MFLEKGKLNAAIIFPSRLDAGKAGAKILWETTPTEAHRYSSVRSVQKSNFSCYQIRNFKLSRKKNPPNLKSLVASFWWLWLSLRARAQKRPNRAPKLTNVKPLQRTAISQVGIYAFCSRARVNVNVTNSRWVQPNKKNMWFSFHASTRLEKSPTKSRPTEMNFFWSFCEGQSISWVCFLTSNQSERKNPFLCNFFSSPSSVPSGGDDDEDLDGSSRPAASEAFGNDRGWALFARVISAFFCMGIRFFSCFIWLFSPRSVLSQFCYCLSWLWQGLPKGIFST